jgi:hypothetical protein
MGNQNRARDPGEPHPALEAALARLAKAFGEAEAERVRLDEIRLELGRAPASSTPALCRMWPEED